MTNRDRFDSKGQTGSQVGQKARWRQSTRVTGLVAAVIALAIVAVGATGQVAQAAPAPASLKAQSSPVPLSAKDVNAWLDGLVPAALASTGIAGAAVTVVHDGKILTTRGFGYSTVGVGAKAVAVDPNTTLFRVGSVSKMFTDTAVMQLVQAGKLDLDVDISKYLDFTIPRKFDQPITLRDLMTHTAGFEDRGKDIVQFGVKNESLRDTVMLDPPEQIFQPGTTPAYSNYSNALAGYIVQRVSKTAYSDYLAKNVLGRAGMSSSSFDQPLPAALAKHLSHGYSDVSQPAEPFEVIGPAPAGALSSTPRDMGTFMLAQLGELPKSRSLLEPATLALMQKPALTSATLGAFAKGPRMSLGFFDESRNGRRILGHGGDTEYFHSHVQIYPDDKTGVFVTMNSIGRSGIDTLDLRDAVLNGFADRYFPASRSAATAKPALATAVRDSKLVAGTYESDREIRSNFGDILTLTAPTTVTAQKDGTLLFEPGPNSAYPATYKEIAPSVWQDVDGQQIATTRTTNGVVTAIGYDDAFALLRSDPLRTSAVAFPILIVSMLILLLALILWPVGALVRRYFRVAERPGGSRLARILTRVGIGTAVVALVGWYIVIMAIGDSGSVPDAILRGLQVLGIVGVLAIVPSGWLAVSYVRFGVGRVRVVASALVPLALIGVAWFSLAFKLIAPSVSY
jgi:CubicO group peptidase (beta-lactamase class C family)